jgi:hypothetical protein
MFTEIHELTVRLTSTHDLRKLSSCCPFLPETAMRTEGPSVAKIETIPDPTTRPTISAREAFALLGISHFSGYELIRQGKFPVPVLRLGYKLRIPTAPLLELLGLRPGTPAEPESREAEERRQASPQVRSPEKVATRQTA